MIDLSELILRSQTKPPYVTKGDKLTALEIDGNNILLGDFLLALQSSSDVPAYDPSTLYDSSRSDVVKYNSKLYVATYAGSPAEFSGIVPTNKVYWTEISIGSIAHQKDRDDYLARGTDNEVTAEALKDLLTGLTLKFKTVTLTASQVQSGNSVPVEALPAQPGVMYDILDAVLDNNFDETSPGDTPYVTNTGIALTANGADIEIGKWSTILSSTKRVRQKIGMTVPTASTTRLIPDESVNIYAVGGDPTGGTHGITVHIIYIEIPTT